MHLVEILYGSRSCFIGLQSFLSSSKELCVDARLMLYERLCFSFCCNDIPEQPEASKPCRENIRCMESAGGV